MNDEEFYKKRGYRRGTYEQKLREAGYDVDALLATGQYGQNINPGEYQRIISQYGQGENPYRNASQVLTQNAPRPDDLLGIRDQLYDRLGVNEAFQRLQEAKKRLQEFDEATASQQQSTLDRKVSMSKITGILRSNANKRSLERQSYANEFQTLKDLYATKVREANAQLALREKEIEDKKRLMLQYAGAGITFGDSFEDAIRKIERYTKKLNEEAKKEAEYKYLRDAYMQVYGYPPKKKYSRKKLRSKIKKRSKALLKEAQERAKKEWQMKVEEHNLRMQNIRSTIASRGRQEREPRLYTQETVDGIKYYRYNQDTGKLEPVEINEPEVSTSCPEGQVWDETLGQCVDNSPMWETLGWGDKIKQGASWLYNKAKDVGSWYASKNPWANFWK